MKNEKCKNCLHDYIKREVNLCENCFNNKYFEPKSDNVNHPAHYQGKRECIDIMVDLFAEDVFCVGENDYNLMKKVVAAGSDHSKFMRMIIVTFDITIPLYLWKEFDTYKVGTVRNSCSTMHKIHEKEFTLEDFSIEHLTNDIKSATELASNGEGTDVLVTPQGIMGVIIGCLNSYREEFLKTNNKKWWWQMVQLLPSSYNQGATLQLNYQVLRNMYPVRKNHKLDEWVTFCKWIEGLPYSELITMERG